MRARMGLGAVLTRGVVVVALHSWSAAPAEAQVRLRDLVVNVGGSVESYAGNFSAVTAPVVDPSDHAVAAVGEVGARGVLTLLRTRARSVEFFLDGGMRQAAAVGFELRDYAPREWAGSAQGRYTQSVGGWGSVVARAGMRARAVRDRPPMPLFLQPGYVTAHGGVGLLTRSFDGATFDVEVDLEQTDYASSRPFPQLDLLDRSSSGLEAGVRWGGGATLRVYGGFRWTDYRNQGSFDPSDPFRRDRTGRVGVEWSYSGALLAQVGVDGTLNRSNSNRPEYDAVSARAFVTAPLPGELSLSAFAVLTGKSYLHATDFARLVPGEEADNASLAYLQLGRPVASNLDAAVRLGWARAETDIGGAYYRRFGASVLFNYRPNGF